MARKSRMQYDFAKVPSGSVPRSNFNLSCGHKTSFNGGYLIPFHWDYRYPGDVDRVSVNAFIRMSSPLDYPLMDNATITVQWYAVALRNIWDNFRKFFGEQVDPGDSIDYTVPVVTSGALDISGFNTDWKRLAHYLGCPLTTVDFSEVSSLPFRAYNSVWNYWHRDQNLQDSVNEPTDDGPDAANTDFNLLQRGKRHDYFTSALPSPQKHDAVDLPLGTSAPIYTDAVGTADVTVHPSSGSPASYIQMTTGSTYLQYSAVQGSASDLLLADLSSATAATINEMRNAISLQQFLEREMRGGTRFGEQIWSHFQVEFQDAHYAPVYLGGGTAPLITTPIANQSGSTGNVGDLAAIASGSVSGAGFSYAYTEPSILLGVICVDADLTYQQGLDRKFSYSTRYDFYWPEFANLGEQEVLNKEIFYQNAAADENAFGYQERYAELRHGRNRVSGMFNSDYVAPLDSWHLAEDFASLPTLNADFIVSEPPFDRVMQVTTSDHFIADIWSNINCARPLPMYGTPGLRRL